MKEIRAAILKYLNEGGNQLEILDEPPKNRPWIESYSGVTIPYLAKYVCQKADIKVVAQAVFDLHEEGEVRALYCHTIKDVVIEALMGHTGHWNYDVIKDDSRKGPFFYPFFINRIEELIK